VSEQIPGTGLVPGSYVAGYRLEERIGHGGMAAVFRAYDSRLDRLVALKVMAPSLAEDDAFRRRFIGESRAAAAVDDPHIIPVYAAGEADGVLFIAMRLVRGGDVLSLIERGGPLPAGRAAEIVSQVASALDAAHARGLVHRDVKPANMLLEASQTFDRRDHVYLSDFGLTKASLAVSGLTATGQFLGTLDYIAPEQIESRPIDGRTDQYSLACAAFEMLTGQPPFRRHDTISVMYAQLNDPPPLVGERRSDLPAAVDAVIGRALSKAPADRYQTCREFAAALRDALRAAGPGRAVPAHPATEIAMAGPAPQSHPAPESRPAPAGPGSAPPAESGSAPPPGVSAPADSGSAPPAGPGSAPSGPAARPAAAPEPAGAGSAPMGAGHTQAAGYQSAAGAPPPLTPPPAAMPAAAGPPAGGPPTAGPAAEPRWPDARRQPASPATGPISGPAGGSTSPGLTRPVSNGGEGGLGPPGSGRRPWWRSPLPVAAICAVVLLAGGGAYALSGHGKPTVGGGTHKHKTQLPVLSLPGCSTKTAPAPTLNGVTSATVATGGSPFGIAVTPDGQFSFVSTGSDVDLLRNTSGLAPELVRAIPASHASKSDTLTPDGKYLLAAASSGAVVLNVAQAEQGAANPVAGTLISPGGKGAFQALVSADGKFAFVTLQNSNKMAVFNLKTALGQGFPAGDFVGDVPMGDQPVGLATDGTWLYVTNLGGTISIVNEHQAETHPAAAVFKTVRSGCGSARAMLSHGVLWVTARDSDELLAFDPARLRTDPRHALIARVAVGEAPLGETFADNGRRIVLVDSNLNSLNGAVSSIAVVDTARALAGKPALLGYIPTGQVPRAVVVEPGGSTLLVTDEHAGQLQALRVADVP